MSGQASMQICQRCGGARFYAGSIVGWGGLVCHCTYPQVPIPDVPPQTDYDGNYQHLARKRDELTMQVADIAKERDELKDQVEQFCAGVQNFKCQECGNYTSPHFPVNMVDEIRRAHKERDELTKQLALEKARGEKLVEALKHECCCPGEASWTTGKPILCDPCEAIAAYEAKGE